MIKIQILNWEFLKILSAPVDYINYYVSYIYVKLLYINGFISHPHSNNYSEIYLGNLLSQVLPVILILYAYKEVWEGGRLLSQNMWIAAHLLCYSLNSENENADFQGHRTLFFIDSYHVIPQPDSHRFQLFTFSCFAIKLQIIVPCKTLISI